MLENTVGLVTQKDLICETCWAPETAGTSADESPHCPAPAEPVWEFSVFFLLPVSLFQTFSVVQFDPTKDFSYNFLLLARQ